MEIRDAAVETGTVGDGELVATLTRGQQVSARRLILATGLADALPDVEGLADIWGRSAFHCPYCDGWETQGKGVAVLADGDAAVRLALPLVRFTPEITVCTNGAGVSAAGERLLSTRGIGVRREAVASLARDGDQVRAVEFASVSPLPADVVFVAAPFRQRSDLAEQLGCDLLDDGTVEVNDFGQTSVPGVYAAGDMARKAAYPGRLAQIMFAAASGQLAGAMIDQDLLLADIPDYPSPLRQDSA